MEKYMSARKCLLISFCYLFVTNTISVAKIFVFYWRKGIKRVKNSFEKKMIIIVCVLNNTFSALIYFDGIIIRRRQVQACMCNMRNPITQ